MRQISGQILSGTIIGGPPLKYRDVYNISRKPTHLFMSRNQERFAHK